MYLLIYKQIFKIIGVIFDIPILKYLIELWDTGSHTMITKELGAKGEN